MRETRRGDGLKVRLAAFAAAFLLPFAVAALPLLSIAFTDPGGSHAAEELAVTDVPAQSIAEDGSQPMAYGNSDATSSIGCGETSIVAIEG